jgi:hypothetical protein
METYKPNILTRFGYFIAGIGIAYNNKGLKGAFNYMWVEPLMLFLKYIYNHTKWGNKLIKKRVNRNIPKDSKILLSDVMFNYENIDWKDFYDNLPEDKKEGFDYIKDFYDRQAIYKKIKRSKKIECPLEFDAIDRRNM